MSCSNISNNLPSNVSPAEETNDIIMYYESSAQDNSAIASICHAVTNAFTKAVGVVISSVRDGTKDLFLDNKKKKPVVFSRKSFRRV